MSRTGHKRSAGARMLREWLDEHGKTQAWLGERIGVSAHQVWHWANGSRTPRGDRAIAIETETGVPASAWWEEDR